jgi:FkbM family methyltransferase
MSSFAIGAPYRLTSTSYGTMLVNPNDFYMGAAYLKYGECCQTEIDFLLRLLSVPGQVIEVGANMGVHTVPMAMELARQGRTMLAFEPQPVIFQQLCANLALNGLMNVTAMPYAIGAEAGVVSFAVPDYRVLGNFGATEMLSQGAASQGVPPSQVVTQQIACFPLDSYVGSGDVALIKIDVEGFELAVLKGAVGTIKRARPILYVENDRTAQSAELIGWLLEHRYRLWWHTPFLFNPANRLGVQENIYQGIASINMFCIPAERNYTVQGMEEIFDPDKHPLLATEK